MLSPSTLLSHNLWWLQVELADAGEGQRRSNRSGRGMHPRRDRESSQPVDRSRSRSPRRHGGDGDKKPAGTPSLLQRLLLSWGGGTSTLQATFLFVLRCTPPWFRYHWPAPPPPPAQSAPLPPAPPPPMLACGCGNNARCHQLSWARSSWRGSTCGACSNDPPHPVHVKKGPAHGSGPREFDHPLREKGVEGGETGLFST